ncbi:hypothetical protein BH09ACT8_BH09ACT8_52750 [soil metagenome]
MAVGASGCELAVAANNGDPRTAQAAGQKKVLLGLVAVLDLDDGRPVDIGEAVALGVVLTFFGYGEVESDVAAARSEFGGILLRDSQSELMSCCHERASQCKVVFGGQQIIRT